MLVCAFVMAAGCANVEADEAAIRSLVAKYAQSIDEASTALASDIWLNSPNVSFIQPRGHQVGWEAIHENFYRK